MDLMNSNNTTDSSTTEPDSNFIGPDYPYASNIKAPGEMAMGTTSGRIDANLSGLINYINILISGKSDASTTGGPFGNKYFLKTIGECKATDTGKNVPRYIYINNVPTGGLGFISKDLANKDTGFKGLIPGTMNKLNDLNPLALMHAFNTGYNPDCKQIKLETIDVNNNKGSETHYVALVDINNQHLEGFTSNSLNSYSSTANYNPSNVDYVLPDDPVVQLYFAGISGLVIYILYMIIHKNHL
jgi:hypothetical protein